MSKYLRCVVAIAATAVALCAPPACAITYSFHQDSMNGVAQGHYELWFGRAGNAGDALTFSHSSFPGFNFSGPFPSNFADWSASYTLTRIQQNGSQIVLQDFAKYFLSGTGGATNDFDYPNGTSLSLDGTIRLLIDMSVGGFNINSGVFFLSVTVPDGIMMPVPAALPLFATGLGALGLITYRRRRTGGE